MDQNKKTKKPNPIVQAYNLHCNPECKYFPVLVIEEKDFSYNEKQYCNTLLKKKPVRCSYDSHIIQDWVHNQCPLEELNDDSREGEK